MARERALRLRVFVGDASRAEHEPLFRAIVGLLHEKGVAGATVLRGSMSFGATNRVHSVASEHTATDLPLVIESVDRPERIEAVLPDLARLVKDGLVVVEDVRVVTRTDTRRTC